MRSNVNCNLMLMSMHSHMQHNIGTRARGTIRVRTLDMCGNDACRTWLSAPPRTRHCLYHVIGYILNICFGFVRGYARHNCQS